ncbi:hypothetical protein F4779DRAFT_617590 [Xylariaceae sp. FL0662B]|nr:hypothetical protein F4779DRAFT_617590 [Xylariaceae sp. FL0662B]
MWETLANQRTWRQADAPGSSATGPSQVPYSSGPHLAGDPGRTEQIRDLNQRPSTGGRPATCDPGPGDPVVSHFVRGRGAVALDLEKGARPYYVVSREISGLLQNGWKPFRISECGCVWPEQKIVSDERMNERSLLRGTMKRTASCSTEYGEQFAGGLGKNCVRPQQGPMLGAAGGPLGARVLHDVVYIVPSLIDEARAV